MDPPRRAAVRRARDVASLALIVAGLVCAVVWLWSVSPLLGVALAMVAAGVALGLER